MISHDKSQRKYIKGQGRVKYLSIKSGTYRTRVLYVPDAI